MKKKVISAIVGGFIIAASVFGTSMRAFASSGSGVVRVPTGGTMVNAVSNVTRTRDYNYVSVKAQAVYPVGNYSTDNFTQCKAAIYHCSIGNTPISRTKTLTEGQGYYNIVMYEGYLDLTRVNLHFAGNNSEYSAYVSYFYNGN